MSSVFSINHKGNAELDRQRQLDRQRRQKKKQGRRLQQQKAKQAAEQRAFQDGIEAEYQKKLNPGQAAQAVKQKPEAEVFLRRASGAQTKAEDTSPRKNSASSNGHSSGPRLSRGAGGLGATYSQQAQANNNSFYDKDKVNKYDSYSRPQSYTGPKLNRGK